MQTLGGGLGVLVDLDRLADRDDEFGLLQPPLRLAPLRPDPLRPPDHHGDQWDVGLVGDTCGTILDLLDLEGTGDRRLREDADEFSTCGPFGGLTHRRRTVGTVDGDVLAAAHGGPGNLVVPDLLLRHEADEASSLVGGGDTAEDEVPVAGVVHRDHRTAVGGDTLRVLDLHLQVLHATHPQLREGDDEPTVEGLTRFRVRRGVRQCGEGREPLREPEVVAEKLESHGRVSTFRVTSSWESGRPCRRTDAVPRAPPPNHRPAGCSPGWPPASGWWPGCRSGWRRSVPCRHCHGSGF